MSKLAIPFLWLTMLGAWPSGVYSGEWKSGVAVIDITPVDDADEFLLVVDDRDERPVAIGKAFDDASKVDPLVDRAHAFVFFNPPSGVDGVADKDFAQHRAHHVPHFARGVEARFQLGAI